MNLMAPVSAIAFVFTWMNASAADHPSVDAAYLQLHFTQTADDCRTAWKGDPVPSPIKRSGRSRLPARRRRPLPDMRAIDSRCTTNYWSTLRSVDLEATLAEMVARSREGRIRMSPAFNKATGSQMFETPLR